MMTAETLSATAQHCSSSPVPENLIRQKKKAAGNSSVVFLT
jgi:hypothetical protein